REPDAAIRTVERLLGQGEASGIEYKASLRFDLKTGAVNKALTRAVVKTVAAFMNGEGGTLLIGVADDGSVVGIANDLTTLKKPDVDGFELALRDAIGDLLGEDLNSAVDAQFAHVSGETIAIVTCKAHDRPVYLQDKTGPEFFVRSGNSSRPLDVREAINYV